jgi:hypothetical protein
MLPAMNSSAASAGQGTVNCPYVTDPCGLVTSHIALCVWYLTYCSSELPAWVLLEAVNRFENSE